MPFDVGALCHGTFKQDGFHVSTARLDALSVIIVCRVGDRCVGMQMQYLDGDMKVLGQWYPETESSYSCFFDNSQVSLKSLCFESTSEYFTDIRVLNEEPSSEAHQKFELGEVHALRQPFSRLSMLRIIGNCMVVFQHLRPRDASSTARAYRPG
jgi:hypothetical protein